MKRMLANHNERVVRKTAEELTAAARNEREKLEAIFYYVRDGIRFGFPAAGDYTTAQKTIRIGIGQCNTKSALMLALCRAAGFAARIHFSLIRRDIQRGVFPEFAFRRLPEELSHSWLEVRVDGQWHRIDTYINDQPFYQAGKRLLQKEGRTTGYSVSCDRGAATDALQLEQEAFVQMDAVTEDHGTWESPEAYYATGPYKNRPGICKLLLYRLLRRSINRRLERIRKSGVRASGSR